MNNVKLSHPTIRHLKPIFRQPPPPITSAPCSHLQNLHLLPSAVAVATHENDFPTLLKACTSLGLLTFGRNLHQCAVVLGFVDDPYLATSLLHLYATNGLIFEARQVFDRMPFRDIVPFSAIIAAYSRSANMSMAFSTYNEMLNNGIRPNSVTLLGLLSGVSELGRVQCLHALVVQFGFDSDLVVTNSMINVYSVCGRVDLARVLFDSMPVKDNVSWNSMVAGYSRSAEVRNSIDLFHKMRLAGFLPDQQTYGSLLASLANNGSFSFHWSRLIHDFVVTSGLESDSHLVTALISMYLKVGDLDYAFMLFDISLEKDVVLWTAMISGLAQIDRASEAVFIFHQMLSSARLIPSTAAIASALSACAQLGMFRTGASIHGFVIRQYLPLDTAAKNSLITLYAKCSHLRQCQKLFEAMRDRDLVSWNAVVSGFAHNGHLGEAFHFFIRMISAMQRPDKITVVSLLQGCASLGALHQGKMVHNFMIRHELKSFISMETSLVDMYCKCGDIKAAQKCFDRMLEQDVVSCSVIIAGYGSHGMGNVALRMYSDFLSTEMEPNSVMFLSMLSACSHSGFVSEGLAIFNSMKEEFSIEPGLEHCACIVDLLCRAGNVEEAFWFFRMMSPKANADILGIILDACRGTGSADLAEVAKEMTKLMPESARSYVQLAQSYAAMNHWDGVGEIWIRMRSSKLKKTPGWSFVEVNGNKSTFFAGDASHLQWDEMICLLKVLENEMKDEHEMPVCGSQIQVSRSQIK